MHELLDILEEQAWLEIMNEQGLLNAKGKLKLHKLNRQVENLALIIRDMEAADESE